MTDRQGRGKKLDTNTNTNENFDLNDLHLIDSILNSTSKPILKIKSKSLLKKSKSNIEISLKKGHILQFKNCSERMQNIVAEQMFEFWKEDFIERNIDTPFAIKRFIIENFNDKLNMFFVFFDDNGYFISTFAVDTTNLAPFISHLFVRKELRGKGFGVRSLILAEKYVKKLGFMCANLWCEDHMIDFYKKNGYIVDEPIKISAKKTVWKMLKNI
jgi:GNAT superfamily N-acetyltransferase